MGYVIKEGYGKNGMPPGRRALREPEKVENNFIKDPKNLIIDIVKFLQTVVYISIRNVIRILTGKPKSLRGKVCFVTGSGRGLGRGICIALAKKGAILACADINEEANNKTVEILTGMGAKAKAYKLNVANKQEVDAVASRVESDLGVVYLLVNNAAIVLPSPGLDEDYVRAVFGVNNAAIVLPSPGLDEDYVRAVFGVNTLGPIWTMGAFLPKMKEKNEGHIVNISSVGAAVGSDLLSTYCASKAAISSYSETLRTHLYLSGYDNIFVTTVHPGMMNTSPDYTEMLKGRMHVHDFEDVAEFTVNSIKYNKGTVSTDGFLFFIGHFLKFLPREIVASMLNIADIQGTLPTAEEYQQMESRELVKKCNCIGGEQ